MMTGTLSKFCIAVGLSEVKVTRGPDAVLVAYGLGSCVALCAWDPASRIAGMAHIVLPRSPRAGAGDTRYADRAVPELLERLTDDGAPLARLVLRMAGGASLLSTSAPEAESLGCQNSRAVLAALAGFGLGVSAADVGGKHGRTVTLDPTTGSVVVRTLGRGEVML